jgi:hypothetical protein
MRATKAGESERGSVAVLFARQVLERSVARQAGVDARVQRFRQIDKLHDARRYALVIQIL